MNASKLESTPAPCPAMSTMTFEAPGASTPTTLESLRRLMPTEGGADLVAGVGRQVCLGMEEGIFGRLQDEEKQGGAGGGVDGHGSPSLVSMRVIMDLHIESCSGKGERSIGRARGKVQGEEKEGWAGGSSGRGNPSHVTP
jgi:hypothetical protein